MLHQLGYCLSLMLLNIVLISLSLWIRLHTSSSLLYIFSLIHQLHLAILVESIYYIRGTIYEGKSIWFTSMLCNSAHEFEQITIETNKWTNAHTRSSTNCLSLEERSNPLSSIRIAWLSLSYIILTHSYHFKTKRELLNYSLWESILLS